EMEVLGIAAYLGADVALRDRIRVAPANRNDAPVLDAHIQAAGIRTIERAGARGPRRTGCPGRTQVHQANDSTGARRFSGVQGILRAQPENGSDAGEPR